MKYSMHKTRFSLKKLYEISFYGNLTKDLFINRIYLRTKIFENSTVWKIGKTIDSIPFQVLKVQIKQIKEIEV